MAPTRERPPDDATADSPFHPGERAVQSRVGVRERMESIGQRLIRDFMPDQHREFFETLPYLVLGGLDDRADVWASMLAGPPGFAHAPDARTLSIRATPPAGDPLAAHLVPGAPVGVLGIELATRRRNRVNGVLTDAPAGTLRVAVQQSFGNCPQYIQARSPTFRAPPAAPAGEEPASEGARLSDTAVALIARADTFFLASASRAAASEGSRREGVDVSHRGGRPGFVRVTREDAATVLTVPDFRGNFMFNTLGNLAVNPRAGLLFVDFESGALLSLTGDAEVIWDGPELDRFVGAERLVRVRMRAGVRIPAALPFRWSAVTPSREVAPTGTWDDVAGRASAIPARRGSNG
jgi:predicted pyridoxine 5'-phosphate oxidase superfamily flavin-nucleotide-binding protein